MATTTLITGANKSIGFEVARRLAGAGWRVFLGARDRGRGAEAVGRLHQAGYPSVELLVIDVSDEGSVEAAARELERRTDSLDVLVNNAGIRGKVPQPPSATEDADIKAVFETNFFGPVRVIRQLMPLLRRSPQPRIVNVTSDLASLTLHNDPSWIYYPVKGAAYGPSKTALNAYTVALAYELRDTPFKVNAVNPGFTATDFNEHRGTKQVGEAAEIIVQYAMLGPDGPTGQFVSDYGVSPW